MPNYKVIDADKFDSDLTMLADGIRAKIGTTAPLHFPDEMAEAIRTRGAKIVPKTIEANGEYYAEEDGADGYSPLTINVGAADLESFIVGDTTELTLRTITEINGYAFQRDTKITKLTAPNVTKIGERAFNLSDVMSISMPKLKEIGNYAFAESQIETLDAPQLETIGMYAFNLCESLGLTSLPNALRYIGNYAFHKSGITLRELPEHLETIGDFAFAVTDTNISEFPASIKSIGISNFIGSATGVITFKGIPNSIGSSAFSPYSQITTINVPWSEGWVSGAPWGATDATINYDVYGDGTPLNDTRWRFNDHLPYDATFLFEDYDFWRIEVAFFANGVEYYAMEWDGGLNYITAEGEYHQATDYYYDIDDEGNEIEYYKFNNEADREITFDAGFNWEDVVATEEYNGEYVPNFFFYEWLHKYAEKL